MTTYYATDLLKEMEDEYFLARERLAVRMGKQTFKNLKKPCEGHVTLQECINLYRNNFDEQENTG